MTEKTQEKVIAKLLPYKERIEELIEKNVLFLFTGNALEVLGKYIENEDGSKIEGLGIFDIYAKRDMMHRHNSLMVGKFEDIEIIGFKSQFTMMYGDNSNIYFLEEKDRLCEIIRLLGGDVSSVAAQTLAKELLESCNKYKKVC